MTTHSGDVLTDADLEKMLSDAYEGALPEKTTTEPPAAPAAEVTKEAETPEVKDAGATPPAADVPATPAVNDPLAALPEDARAIVQAEFARLQRERDQATQNYNAQLGRVRAMEKQKQQAAATPAKPAKPATPPQAEDDWLKDVRAVDPELAKYLELAETRAATKAEQRFKQELDQLREREIAPLQHSRVEEEALKEERILDQVVPNWRDAAQDPYFQAYVQALPPFMQEKLNNTTKADELLYFFDDYNRRFFPNATPGGDPAKATPAAPAAQPSVTAQRQQKLAASVAPAGSTPSPKPDVVDEAKLLAEAYETVSSARYKR